MNKKIIAIAVASVMAAPVATVMAADGMTVTGAFVGEIVSRNKTAAQVAEAVGDSTLAFEDGGANALNFNATSGNVYGKMGLNVGPGAGGGFNPTYRDFHIGYKFSGSTVQFGSMNGALKNLEKDLFIATFLQTRGTYASATTGANPYDSSGYVSNVIQYKGKVGPGTLIVQYNPTSKVTTAADEGHTGLSYAAKAGGINYYVGFNNGQAADVSGNSQSNMKLGGNMKFGTVKVGLNYTAADNNGAKATAIAVDATMSMGNGMSVNANLGTTTGDFNEGTTTRIAVKKSLAKKAFLYAGYQSNKPKSGDTGSELGLGIGIKF